MNDAAQVMRTVLDGLGPTNRIARALVNRLDLAEDRLAEAEAIRDELGDIAAAIGARAAAPRMTNRDAALIASRAWPRRNRP